MSELEKALEAFGGEWESNAFGVIVHAARRFASLTSPETKVWLCREDDKVHDWAYGTEPNDPHCWYNGPRKHNPDCGEYFVLRSVDEGTQ